MKIDLIKLASLRDEHARLLDDYRLTSKRARDASLDVGRFRRELASPDMNDTAHQILNMHPSDVGCLGVDFLVKSRLDPRDVRRVYEAHVRATQLQGQAATIASRLKDSSTLMQRINEFASPLENLR